ncbi:MAG: PLP-dependent aminotransferase family protein [Thermoleophilia bacterium]|nr:PLP-dependent aminotransferase family protein [Thermoleophilia bacterium]
MPDVISFARGAPAPEALDGDLIARCTSEALAADPTVVLSYGTGGGYPPLREWLATHHGTTADRVLITNGSLEGYVFLLETFLAPGDLIALEAPTYDRALLQARIHGMEILPIPMQSDGMDVDVLAAACSAGHVPRLVYTIPNFHNPAGTTISAEKRRALIALAEQYDFWILEDDPYGRLRFEGEDIAGIYDMAGPDRVMFSSSFSKTLAPGLRVGYLVAPPDLVAQLVTRANQTYISPAHLPEAAVFYICAGGLLEPNIVRVTDLMRVRRDAMAAGLVHLPTGTRCVPPEGGFFMWAELPDGISADALLPRAQEAGVIYVAGSACFTSGHENTMRLAYSGVSLAEITEGMERLGQVLRTAG